MTTPDNPPAPDDRAASTSRTTAIIGALAVVALAIVGVFLVLRDDDSDSVSTASDPAAESSAPTIEADTTTEPSGENAPATDEATAAAAVSTLVDDSTAADTDTPVPTDAPTVEPAPTEPATTPAVAEPASAPAPATANYRVTFDANWVTATHPSTLPGNAHFSDPVIAVHDEPGAMFATGQVASPGMEEMAEVGRTTTLLDELSSVPGVTFADSVNGIDAPAVGARSFDVTLTQSASLISLVTMLAPSPDWFVGFADFNTFVDGQWIDTVTFDVGSYDAGTDNGPDFVSDNADSDPAEPIAGPLDEAFAAAVAEGVFGTVTITSIG